MTVLTKRGYTTSFRGYFCHAAKENEQILNFALWRKGNVIPLQLIRLAGGIIIAEQLTASEVLSCRCCTGSSNCLYFYTACSLLC